MAADIDKFFRAEAREILEALARGLLHLEKTPHDVETIKECFRLAHTLKGAARVVERTRISEMAHAIEDALSPFRDGGEEISGEYVNDLLTLLEAVRTEVGALHAGRDAPPRTPHSELPEDAGFDRIETVRVEVDELNALLEGLSEATIQLGPLKAAADSVRQAHQAVSSVWKQLDDGPLLDAQPVDRRSMAKLRAALGEVTTTLSHAQRELRLATVRIDRELEEVHARAHTMRLVPVDAVVGQLEIAAHDAAITLDKQVEFAVTGGDVRLEAHVLSVVRDALIHLIRNAIDHGIESPSERMKLGKSVPGRVDLTVERHGERISFRCGDDGRGFDADAVRRSAADRHLISATEAEALSREEVLKLAFHAGVSTSRTVTEISGRGVGLDVVREAAARLKGEVSIESETGRGTKVRLEVPLSLSSLSVLAVIMGGSTVLIPLDVVRGTTLVTAGEVACGSQGDFIHHEGQALPFIVLSNLLAARTSAAEVRLKYPAVILQSANQWIAVGVERLLGTMDALVKPLPSAVGVSPLVAGAAFDSAGDPLLVLDPREVLRRSRTPLANVASDPILRRLPILVIDDSLTTRMLEQSILEAAGYEVHLAASGEEGLRKAKERSYGLFIVDIEMPGMNGVEFTELTRDDPVLREVPVIIVTSLSSAADRRRSTEAGASAYIVKSEFDQKNFVRRIAEFVRRV